MVKFKKGDTVIVTTGRSKKHVGTIDYIDSSTSYVIISGANIKHHFVKRDPQKNEQGGIVKKEGKLHISNISHYDADKSERFRVGFKSSDDGKRKIRYNKSTGQEV